MLYQRKCYIMVWYVVRCVQGQQLLTALCLYLGALSHWISLPLETVNLNNLLICIKTTRANYSCKIKCFQDFKSQVPHLAHSGLTLWWLTHLSTYSVTSSSSLQARNEYQFFLIKKYFWWQLQELDSSEDFLLIVSSLVMK